MTQGLSPTILGAPVSDFPHIERRNREPEATAEASSVMNRWAHRTWGLIGVVAVIGIFVGVLHPAAVAAQTPGGPVARAVSVQGAVEARRAGQAPWQTVKLNDTFAPGDAIRVGDRGRADLAMLDQSVLRLNANTEMVVEAVKDQRTGVVNLLRGAAHFFSRGPRSLEVQTPFTVAGVRGTEFLVGVESNRTLLIFHVRSPVVTEAGKDSSVGAPLIFPCSCVSLSRFGDEMKSTGSSR